MSRKLSEAAAWRLIAERIAIGTWVQRGLCHEVDRLYVEEIVSLPTAQCMWRRVRNHFPPIYATLHIWPYAFPKGEADVRVLAALFLALDAQNEQRARRKRPNGTAL